MRDIAAMCRISERTVQNVVTDLEQAGYLSRKRTGDARTTPLPWTAGSVIRPIPTCPSRRCWISLLATTSGRRTVRGFRKVPLLLGRLAWFATKQWTAWSGVNIRVNQRSRSFSSTPCCP
ncbi:MAG: helix-turn-helix domain-containing protein [Streptomyces sp.]